MGKKHRTKREYQRTFTRARIYQILTSNPGITLKGIKREYEKNGYSRVWRVTLWWHRRRMMRDGCEDRNATPPDDPTTETNGDDDRP